MTAANTQRNGIIVSMTKKASDTATVDVNLAAVLEKIRDGKWERQVLKVQSATSDEARDAAKKSLPGVCVSGRFSVRADDAIIEHSGLVQVDLDKIPKERRAQIADAAETSPYVLASFVSPSGTGRKIFVRVPADAKRHAASYRAALKHVEAVTGCPPDVSCKNISRLCFVSYDPNLYHNPGAKELPVDDEAPKAKAEAKKQNNGNASERQRIAENLLGSIQWQSDIKGLFECPGIKKHTTGNGARDCQVAIDGAKPTVFCLHESCRADIEEANNRLRQAIKKAEAKAKRAAAEAKPPPEQTTEAYYDSAKKVYWIQNDRDGWIEISETSLRRHFKQDGISPKCPDDECVSPLDREFNRLQKECDVAFAGPMAGHQKGAHEIFGNRILVTTSPKLIEPADGEFPLIEKFLAGLFGPVQLPYVLGWLKRAVDAVRSGRHCPGQALAMAGPPGAGKSLFQRIITEILGGREASPYRYMSGQTPFNGEFFGAEHLIIEDEAASRDLRLRRNFGAHIKNLTVNQSHSCHCKGRQAITLTPVWRLSISLNSEPENLMILPPLDESIEDKLMLLQARLAPLPLPAETIEQRAELWSALTAELPAFLGHLARMAIPAAMRSERYGVIHYHDPGLLAAIDGLAPETRLLALIDATLFASPCPSTWEGRAEDLESTLFSGAKRDQAKTLLDWPNAAGTYLGRLAKKHPERIQNGRTTAGRFWSITPPGGAHATS